MGGQFRRQEGPPSGSLPLADPYYFGCGARRLVLALDLIHSNSHSRRGRRKRKKRRRTSERGRKRRRRGEKKEKEDREKKEEEEGEQWVASQA